MNEQLHPIMREALGRWASSLPQPAPEQPKSMPTPKPCIHSYVVRDGIWTCLYCNVNMKDAQ